MICQKIEILLFLKPLENHFQRWAVSIGLGGAVVHALVSESRGFWFETWGWYRRCPRGVTWGLSSRTDSVVIINAAGRPHLRWWYYIVCHILLHSMQCQVVNIVYDMSIQCCRQSYNVEWYDIQHQSINIYQSTSKKKCSTSKAWCLTLNTKNCDIT